MLLRVILAMDDARRRKQIRRLLAQDDVIVESLRGRTLLWERAARRSGDIIVAGQSVLSQPPERSIEMVHQLPESPSVVVIADTEDAEQHAGLLAAGCDVVLYAQLPEERLADALEAVVEKRRASAQRTPVIRRPLARPQLSDFVSNSLAMRAFMRLVQRVVHSNTALLILGETGVGKERLARAIHAEGPRSNGPFVAVNCGALPESLLESELFGHEEGAFTGATRSRRGAFEIAHRGTIFLDEIAEMPLHLQVKLLRVLQDHEVQRVGGEEPFTVEVRVMAASNRDLEAEIEDRRFRKDLYYRLSVVCLTIPPLRERREDIPALVESYIEHLGPRIGRPVAGIAESAMDALCRYSWPGNVRELINVVERAMLLCTRHEIALADLPAAIGGRPRAGQSAGLSIPSGPDDVPDDWLARPLKDVRASITRDVEKAYLGALLRRTGGRVGETAERAGIQPRSLYEKMKEYGLRKEDFRRRNQGGR